FIYRADLLGLINQSSTGIAAAVALAAAVLIPIIVAYVLAHMVARTQELRLVAQSMAEVAMRLAEPETLARESIDNEVRIRALLSELSSQRDTLVGQAEQVRNAISSVHLDLSHDITSA